MKGKKCIQLALVSVLTVGISACSSTGEVVEPATDVSARVIETYRPIHKQPGEVPTVGDSYTREETSSVKTVPIIREDTAPKEVFDKDREFNKILTDAQAEKEKKTTERSVVRREGTELAADRVLTILFANGSTTIGSEYDGDIKEAARLAKERNAKITVFGFASGRTNSMDETRHKLTNFKVSIERAKNVAVALVEAGAPEGAVSIEAPSDSNLLYRETLPKGESLNRRAEIYISY